MNKKQKNTLYRIIISAVLMILAFIMPDGIIKTTLFLINYILIGYDVILKSVKNIGNGQLLDENFLMMIATVGAMILSEFSEAVFVMLFYQVGELFQSIAVGKSRKSISDLMAIYPEHANIERDGEIVEVDPEELAVGDIIVIKPGEKIPVDGCVLEGNSTVDTANLTGEAMPSAVSEGSAVISGCVNISGVLRVKVQKEFSDSTVCRILELVESASENKAVSENFITKFAKYYTPIVVACAAALALLPPIILGDGWGAWLHRALVFLVVSCPCALVISVPLSFFGGIGCASKNGILIKGSNFIEQLAKCRVAVFDKTGTLTKGSFEVREVKSAGITAEELIRITAHAECYSNHPIAMSVQKAYSGEINKEAVSDVCEIAGKGIMAKVDGKKIIVGNAEFMKISGINTEDANAAATVIHIAEGDEYRGFIVISDEIKEGAAESLRNLRAYGAQNLVMLTGDGRAAGEAVGEKLGLDRVYARLLPQDKVSRLEELIEQKDKKSTLVYVGDGVNDAPVLTRADVGIAMGAMGSDAAIEAADVVLMDDSIEKIPLALKICKKTMRIVKQNIVFAISVKVLVMILSAHGISGMWEAVFADVGVSVIAILNAMRTLSLSGKNKSIDIIN